MPDYIDAEELAEHLGDTSHKLNTTLLARACEATSRAVEAHCGQRFYLDTSATARVYRPREAEVLRVHPIGSSAGLVVAADHDGDGTVETTWAATDYQLEPLDAGEDAATPFAWSEIAAIDRYLWPLPYRRRPTVQVTARWGWSAVPADVVAACLLKATSLFKRKDAPYGIAGFGDFGAMRISKKDPEVMALLAPFVRYTEADV